MSARSARDGVAVGRVIQRRDERSNGNVTHAAFDADGTLADGRQQYFRCQFGADALAQPKALEAGTGENDGIELAAIELGEARIDVTAQAHDLKLRVERTQLTGAAQAGGADARALRQGVERIELVRDKGIARILAFADHRDMQARRASDGHVLKGMHGDVRAAVEQRLLQLLDEQSLAADLGQRAVENLVAARCSCSPARPASRGCAMQTLADMLGLPQGERAFTGGDTQDS